MKKKEIELKVNKIFKQLFKNSKNNDIKYHLEDRWDSLMHIRLIGALENDFNIKINFSQSPKLLSKNKIIDFLIKQVS